MSNVFISFIKFYIVNRQITKTAEGEKEVIRKAVALLLVLVMGSITAIGLSNKSIGKMNWIVENTYQEGFNIDLDDGKLDATVYLEKEGGNVYYDLWWRHI